jgi:2-polyprenyl-6-hydroxyphenyl methylase/3-demethylubiquinone-9 3-methyltransferase
VDGTAEMIAAALRLDGAGDSRIAYRTCRDLAHLSLADESFDGVLCSSVLEYLDEPTRVLDEFWRITRPGGALIVTLPNPGALVRRAQRIALAATRTMLVKAYPEYLSHVRCMWTRTEAIALVSAAGYEVRTVSIGGLGWGPESLDRRAFWGPLFFILARRRPRRATLE